MIISHSKKFIFIHIQKNAGTSITQYLDKHLNYQDTVLGCTKFGEKIQPLFSKKYGLKKHSLAKRIQAVTGDEVWNNYFSFSFVRNPWARVVSLYTWCRKKEYYKYDICKEALNSKNFSEFARGKCVSDLPQQLDYLTNSKGKIIVDFVGKQESIQDDFKFICSKISIPYSNVLKNPNKSNFDTDYRKYYTSEHDIKLIENKFINDINRFDYQF